MHSAFRILQTAFLSIDFSALRKIDFNFGGSISWNTQCNCVALYNKGYRTPSATLPPVFYSADDQVHWAETILCTKVAARLRFAILTHGDDAKNHRRCSWNFHQGNHLHGLRSFFSLRWTACLWAAFFSKIFPILRLQFKSRTGRTRKISTFTLIVADLLSHTFLLLSTDSKFPVFAQR